MPVLNQVNNARPTCKVIETGTVGLTPLNVFLPSTSYPCNRKVVLLRHVTRQDSVNCHITGCVTGRLWLLDPSPAPSHGHISPGFMSVSRGKCNQFDFPLPSSLFLGNKNTPRVMRTCFFALKEQ